MKRLDALLLDLFDPEEVIHGVRLESPIEACLYLALSRVGLELATQVQIGPYRVDMAYPAARLVIECDGHEYHSSKHQRAEDASRDRGLLLRGWVVMRFTGTEIWDDPESCIREIRDVVTARTRLGRV